MKSTRLIIPRPLKGKITVHGNSGFQRACKSHVLESKGEFYISLVSTYVYI